MSALETIEALRRAREAALERRRRATLHDPGLLFDLIVRLSPPPALAFVAPRTAYEILELQRLLFKAAVVLERAQHGGDGR
jgi:hypothetical protein